VTGPAQASAISVRFLRDDRHGGAASQLTEVASALADFVAAATRSVELAIYDFRLADEQAAAAVVDAFVAATSRGVAVRIGYDAGKPTQQTTLAFAALGGDPAPVGTQQWLSEHFAGTPVQLRAIQAGSQLMHSKYVVRDAPADGATDAPDTAAVWTGSTNFTDDAWTRQENNIVTVSSAELAAGYRADFDQMWTTGAIRGSGARLGGRTTVAGSTITWDFSPGDGPALDAGLVAQIEGARERLVVAAMVLTSHDILSALAGAIDRGVQVAGIYDGGQMDPIVRGWRSRDGNEQVLADWAAVSAELARKNSTPYSPTGPHDFMHLKVLLADDTVATGSYNFSANAERNAENQLRIEDPATLTAYSEFLDAVVRAYSWETTGSGAH
jgi:phosphatidylserine/phosphatidylglycerophosphate/cardiolipin synthase-like enzyme